MIDTERCFNSGDKGSDDIVSTTQLTPNQVLEAITQYLISRRLVVVSLDSELQSVTLKTKASSSYSYNAYSGCRNS